MEDFNSHFSSAFLGKKILITGGSTGIGRASAILLSSLGAKCLICGRNDEPLRETLAAIKSKKLPDAIAVEADLSSGEGIRKVLDAVDSELGGLDILINNAALGYGSITDGGYEDWQYILNTNLLAYMACSQEAINRFKSAGAGQIINIGSMSADVREEKSSVYVATKAGIQGFSEALRKEINPLGIRLLLIEPGAVDTDMQPASKEEKLEQIEKHEMLPADDIAWAIAFCIAQPPASDVVNLKIRPHLQLI
ncbi:SDR family NAD(P)-dependent oxidoreductase [Pedobacter sp. MC2016-05]|uniref:SDR family oxidoreductase n=1 Tax=Pedobacter sp. MC2016-05 TaxID=2994474 RepID=UPI002245AF7F|nr:SDR family oxidoreductase [Pedobacter sp. MC2016-05]MCX2474425.1 SDR family NAD(P)-dependent oxidoreductase [Pedobacter sp. MC2016-05]